MNEVLLMLLVAFSTLVILTTSELQAQLVALLTNERLSLLKFALVGDLKAFEVLS